MNDPKVFYTLAEAADLLGLSKGDVLGSVDAGDSRISFRFAGDLFEVQIIDEAGSTELVELSVPFRGVLRNLQPPDDHDSLTASHVQVLRVNEGGVTFQHSGGQLIEHRGASVVEDGGEQFIGLKDGRRIKPQGKLVMRKEGGWRFATPLQWSFMALVSSA